MSGLHVESCIIDNAERHPNADRLDVVTVKGWCCVTGLGQFKKGQKVIYIPPDSIIPATLIETYKLYSEQLQEDGSIIKKTYFKTTYEDGSARMSTQKLRGIISQGLIIPLTAEEEKKWPIGTDVSKELGIKKWEPEVAGFMKSTSGVTRKKLNPLFDKYTNIENIKNYNKVFKPEDKVYIMEKIHGTNSRYSNLPIYTGNGLNIFKKILRIIKKKIYGGYEFIYGSHNVQLGAFTNNKSFYGENVYAAIAKKYNLNEIIPKNYIIYGEIYGKGIQDLTYGLDNIDLVIFDIKYKGNYLGYEDLAKFCIDKKLPIAPVLYIGEWSDELITKYTDGKSILCPSQIREGCVICDYTESNDMHVGRKILKSISADYLTRKNGTEFH